MLNRGKWFLGYICSLLSSTRGGLHPLAWFLRSENDLVKYICYQYTCSNNSVSAKLQKHLVENKLNSN